MDRFVLQLLLSWVIVFLPLVAGANVLLDVAKTGKDNPIRQVVIPVFIGGFCFAPAWLLAQFLAASKKGDGSPDDPSRSSPDPADFPYLNSVPPTAPSPLGELEAYELAFGDLSPRDRLLYGAAFRMMARPEEDVIGPLRDLMRSLDDGSPAGQKPTLSQVSPPREISYPAPPAAAMPVTNLDEQDLWRDSDDDDLTLGIRMG